MTEHLDTHQHAFLDNNNKVIGIYIFEGHDEILLNQVREHLNANDIKCCCDFGIAYVHGDFYSNKFYKPKPFESWIRNEELGIWDPPIPYPALDEENPRYYTWNEKLLNWEEIQVSE